MSDRPTRAATMLGPAWIVNQHLCVAPDQSGLELDEFLCVLFPRCRKSLLRRAVREGRVLVNGIPAQPSRRLRSDEIVSFDPDDEEIRRVADDAPRPTELRLPILYEDDHVIAVDKPPGVAAEPERWDRGRPHLLGALQAMAEDRSLGGQASFRPRLVHRLDKDTSGVVLVAKTIEGERGLREAFDSQGSSASRLEKSYLALVEGEHPLADGESETIDLPIGPDLRKSGAMTVREDDGKEARTRIQVVRRFRGYTLLACEPLTGRTHQIRVHLAARGFPLAVDPIYSRRKALPLSELKAGYRPKRGRPELPLIDRLTLHARSIHFPVIGETAPQARRGGGAAPCITVEAPLPEDFARVLKQLAKVRPPRP